MPLGEDIDSLPSPEKEMAALRAAKQNNSPEIPDCISTARKALIETAGKGGAAEDLIQAFKTLSGEEF